VFNAKGIASCESAVRTRDGFVRRRNRFALANLASVLGKLTLNHTVIVTVRVIHEVKCGQKGCGWIRKFEPHPLRAHSIPSEKVGCITVSHDKPATGAHSHFFVCVLWHQFVLEC
jgi:hypothetical protein